MKKILLTSLYLLFAFFSYSQTTFYWVGGLSSANAATNANWNTALDGSGSPRTAANPATSTDILVFDGSNLGGATPVTGVATVNFGGSIASAQMKFVNNASINIVRNATGTSTVSLYGDAGPSEDFIIESGSTASFVSTTGSIRMAMASGTTGRVSGNLTMITSLQARFDQLTAAPGSFVFTSGSNFRTNITAASTSYAFGSNSQSAEKWVVFQAGAHLFYEGGYSPMGNVTAFSAIDFQPGSVWHHKANNPATGFGSFFNTKSFANIIVENGATLAADGPIYRIDTLTVTNGSSFITHSTGSTVVYGNMVIDGTFSSQATIRNNTLLLAGTLPQTISGTGTISIPSLTVADMADVVMNKSITALDSAINIYGKLNFNSNQFSGTGNFSARVNSSVTGITGNLTAGSTQVSGVIGTIPNLYGLTVTGAGIAANTIVVNYSTSGATINLSKPATVSGTGVALTFSNTNVTLATSHANGFGASGSVAVTGTKTYQDGINYIINGATTQPFGISTGSASTFINAGSISINAPITTNTGVHVSANFQLNSGKVTIRPLDTVHVMTGAILSGTFSPTTYFVTEANTVSGAQGVLRMDGINASQLLPIGSANYYLPATISPASASDFTAAVFEGITDNGLPNGTQLPSGQKLTKVDAVWNINRINGAGNANLQLQWAQALEGSTFSTFADSVIGIIVNTNPGWSLPADTGNNATNIASGNFSSFGAFGVGAKPPAQPFIFNPLPDKVYGNPDFDPGAISANTTQPIVYTSSNPAVATIVSGNVHITGTGTTTITAIQASDGFYPAANMAQTLTVTKAPLTIKADDKIKPEGDPNPALTITYTGFVYGETAAILTTPATITTTATTASPAGSYPIVVSGATANNYNITFVNGTMTVTPRQSQTITFNAPVVKTYGNADFAAGATSTNTTIPITYTSSNTSVATIIGNNIHIVGAGTSTITASQAGNTFYFPAANVSRTLTVNKANLTVRAADTSKIAGQPNPPFTLVYTGFVLGQNTSALTTQPTASTIATTTSPAGYYSIDVAGGVANNYNFVYVPGRLTIFPASGTSQPYIQAYMSNSNTLTVRLYSPAPDLGDVLVYDMGGRLVMQKNVFMAEGFLNYNFDVQLKASGVYIIRAIGKNLNLKTTIAILKD